jgi:hypothetical protein
MHREKVAIYKPRTEASKETTLSLFYLWYFVMTTKVDEYNAPGYGPSRILREQQRYQGCSEHKRTWELVRIRMCPSVCSMRGWTR